ncbi:MAG: hypothetical protein KDK51_08550 [Deltaproteobacteria bacterium]|nr:hypothetical protein [Deltaproteobacteria bacterium]
MNPEYIWLSSGTSLLRLQIKRKTFLLKYKKQIAKITKKRWCWWIAWHDTEKQIRAWSEGDVLLRQSGSIRALPAIKPYRMLTGVLLSLLLLLSLSKKPVIFWQSPSQTLSSVLQTNGFESQKTEEVVQEQEPASLAIVKPAAAMEQVVPQYVEVTQVKDIEIDDYVVVSSVVHSVEKNNGPMPSRSKSLQRYEQARKLLKQGKISQVQHMYIGVKDPSSHEKKLLSEIYFWSCKRWVENDEIQKAVIDCQKATQWTEHTKAQQFLRESEIHAKNFYMQGYAVEKIDPVKARESYMQAVLYAPTQSLWKKKSLARIKK